MSPVSSDFLPSVTTQRQRQGNVLVVRINDNIPCIDGEGGNPRGETPTSKNVLLLAGLLSM
jgi:hypothetical protein